MALPRRASEAAGVVLRRHGVAPAGEFLPADRGRALDRTLGGGLPKAALTEIHGAETRDAGAVAGFALALVSLILKGRKAALPLLVDRHVGDFPRGRLSLCGRACPRFRHRAGSAAFFRGAETCRRAVDRRGGGAADGACRRHHRVPRQSREARPHRDPPAASPRPGGRPAGVPAAPGGEAEPTAAPVRLVVSPAPAAPRSTLAGPLAGSIGSPGLHA